MSAQVLDISDDIIAALKGPRGTEIATLSVKLANEAEVAKLAAHNKARTERVVATTLWEMREIVARAMGVDPESMRGKGRTRPVTTARAVFSYLAREYTDATLLRVGEELGGQDHTTVLTAARRGAKLIVTNERAQQAASAVAERWNTGPSNGLVEHG